MKQRIVLVTDSADPSGMGAHMLTLGTALAADFDILLAAGNSDAGSRLLRDAATRGLRIKQIDLARLDLFTAWLEGYGADLVHVHAGIGWEGHGLVRAARAAGVPVVRTEHLPYLLTDVVQQAEYRAMLLSVDARIAVSAAVASSHAGHGAGPIRTIRNGVSPAKPTKDRSEVLAELGLAEHDRLVVTVARFTAQKGYDLLVEAAAAVLAEHPDTVFALVGTGPEQDAIAAQIAQAGLGGRVRLLGQRQDVPDLLGVADLFVLPSHFEGLSLALLEAAAAGLPIVATAAGGNSEALGHEHPLLVAPNDAPALAAAIISALRKPEDARAAGAQAQTRFGAQFTAERMAGETAALYHSILSQSADRGAAA